MGNLINTDVLIIGAGLSGLASAYYLRESGKTVTIVESRNRIGGRIDTAGYESNQPIELGATWLGRKYNSLCTLLADLNIDTFEQRIGTKAIYEAISTSPYYLASLPENPEPSLRIKGGSMALISALKAKISAEIILDTRIEKLVDEGESISAFADGTKITAKKVISTIPPNLFVNRIRFEPQLPSELTTLSKNTHTWMGESIKIALRFDKPFWRTSDLSGTIMSNVGPISEMYDHSNYEESHFSLMGFFNGSFHTLSKEERLHKVLAQLRKYFGNKVDDYLSYHETVWRGEEDTFFPYNSHVLPHQNNGHDLFSKAYMNDKLILSGTETSPQYPGYMEGAVYSGWRASGLINI